MNYSDKIKENYNGRAVRVGCDMHKNVCGKFKGGKHSTDKGLGSNLFLKQVLKHRM
jgi:hypothetical protein